MKKISNIKYIASLLLAGLAIYSCQDDDSTNIGSSVKPNLTSTTTSVTVTEGEDAVLNFKLDKPSNKPAQYRLVMLDESTAVDQEDYVIPGCRSNDPDCVAIEENGGPVGYIFTIPAYTTDYSVSIQTFADELPNETKNLKLKVVSNRTLIGTVGDVIIDINIENFVSSDLSIRLNWDGTFTSDGEEAEFCDVDMDLELYSPDGEIYSFSYNDCPEALVLGPEVDDALPSDGTYYLDVSLYTTAGYNEAVNIPARMNFFKAGTSLNRTVDISSFFPMADGGLEEGNGNALITFEITKTGQTYVIKDPSGATVFQGRMSKNLSQKKALKAKKQNAKFKK